jgi:Domain of unknown function (DUF4331)
MSHHFSSPAAKEDGRLNLTDLFIFQGSKPDTTVFIMNVGPDAGIDKSSPISLHPDAIYNLNIDTDGDLKEDIRFRIKADIDNSWKLYQDEGFSAPIGVLKNEIASGESLGITAEIKDGGRAWVGLAADPFVANVAGFFGFTASIEAGTPDYSFFDTPNNKFDGRDIMSIVIEVPNNMLGLKGQNISVWMTITGLEPDHESVQLSRWGLPLAAFVSAGGASEFDTFNASLVSDRNDLEIANAKAYISKIIALTCPDIDANEHANTVVNYFAPVVMPYKLGSAASFNLDVLNGRQLTDNAYDVIMKKLTNRDLKCGFMPVSSRTEFPYVNAPHERADIVAVIDRSK